MLPTSYQQKHHAFRNWERCFLYCHGTRSRHSHRLLQVAREREIIADIDRDALRCALLGRLLANVIMNLELEEDAPQFAFVRADAVIEVIMRVLTP